MTSGIYSITNAKNKKRYIGSAANIEKRWRRHRLDLQKGQHHSRHLQAAWNKYGENAFLFEVVSVCSTDVLTSQEQFWIDAFQTASVEHGYNIAPVAGSQLGVKRSDETRAKLSASHKGYKPNAETRSKLSKSSKEMHQRPDVKSRIIAALTGRRHSDESKAKMSAARVGWQYSDETRSKMSQAASKRRATAETKVKMSAVHHELDSGNYKLTDDDVRQIRRLLADGKTQSEIAGMFGVTQTCISHIKLGKSWSHIK